MENEELPVGMRKLGELLLSLSNNDVSEGLKNEFKLLDKKIQTTDDEKLLDLFREEYKCLAKKVNEEIEFEKKWR